MFCTTPPKNPDDVNFTNKPGYVTLEQYEHLYATFRAYTSGKLIWTAIRQELTDAEYIIEQSRR